MHALPSKSLQYFVAIAATAVALAARFMLESSLGFVAPFILFTLSVVVTAWYGGLGPGILATALGAVLGGYFFIEPLHSLGIHAGARGVEEVLFVCTGVAISVLSQARLTLEARRRKLLASEQEARKAAEEANRLKDEFLSIRVTSNAYIKNFPARPGNSSNQARATY